MVAVAPRAVIAGCAALGPRSVAHGLKLLRRRIAAIGLAFGKQLLGALAMALRARQLVDGLAVPIELEPPQAVENGENGAFGGARLIGILDPEQHLAAFGFGIKPVEQGGASASDVEVAGGRWRKARDDSLAHRSILEALGGLGQEVGVV